MATKSATITVDANLATAYNAAPKTRQKKAQAAMRRVLQESRETRPTVPHLSPEETALFLRINSHLSPEQQSRYDELRTKREAETLTPAEHTELLYYIDAIATLWTDRLQALLDLAQLRRVSPQQLMQQLAIIPPVYEA
jgi:hypothetical protein